MLSGNPTKSDVKGTEGVASPLSFWHTTFHRNTASADIPTIMKQATFFQGSQEPISKKNKDLREYLRVNRERHKRKLERAFMKATLAEYASA